MNFLSQLLDANYLLTNPSVVAALVAGLVTTTVALLTFLGVLLSNGSSSARARADRAHSASQSASEREAMQERITKEHQHAADEAHKERLTTTRRQVYLEAMDAWALAQSNLMKLADSDLSKLNELEYVEKLAASTAKVRVVGDQDTAVAAQELYGEFAQTFAKGLSILLKQGGIRGELEFHDREYAKSQHSIEALLAAMKVYNRSGKTDQAEFTRLQIAYEEEQKNATNHSESANKIRIELLQIGNDFRRQQIDWALSISPKLVDFTCALRRELGIATDPQALHEQMDRLNDGAREAANAFIARINEEVRHQSSVHYKHES